MRPFHVGPHIILLCGVAWIWVYALVQYHFKQNEANGPKSFPTMALSAFKTYVYDPLVGERDFRLVTLQHGTDQDPISLTISHSPLDRSPIYEALSCVWGPQNPSQTIRCNDGTLEIGENLAAALLCLRKPATSRLLWIDRVAINQGDTKERTRQVGLMADI
jgi:hypothetical protein